MATLTSDLDQTKASNQEHLERIEQLKTEAESAATSKRELEEKLSALKSSSGQWEKQMSEAGMETSQLQEMVSALEQEKVSWIVLTFTY